MTAHAHTSTLDGHWMWTKQNKTTNKHSIENTREHSLCCVAVVVPNVLRAEK